MIEVHGLNELISDMQAAPIRLQRRAPQLVEHAVRAGRDDARRFAPRKGLQHYPEKITYDVHLTGHGAVGEFGPERGGQGSLGHILENGTATSPPQAHVGPAFDRQQPAFLRSCDDLNGQLL